MYIFFAVFVIGLQRISSRTFLVFSNVFECFPAIINHRTQTNCKSRVAQYYKRHLPCASLSLARLFSIGYYALFLGERK